MTPVGERSEKELIASFVDKSKRLLTAALFFG